MSNKPVDKTEFTAEEIKCLQNQSDGWESIWERICVELCGNATSKGRLHRAAWRFVKDKPEIDIEDFVSAVLEQYQSKVQNKTLLLNYDYETYGGNVYKFLCSTTIISRIFARYCHENAFIKTPLKQKILTVQNDEPQKNKKGDETDYLIDTIEDKKSKVEYYDEINLLKLLATQKWVLNVLLNSQGNFFQYDIHSGLQLYMQIDYTNNMMNLLRQKIHEVVESKDNSGNKPETKIEKEHQKAKERINEEINKLNDVIYDIQKGKVRNVDKIYKQNINRKIAKKRLQEIYSPLDADQIIELLAVSRNNADKIISRYYKNLTDILPLDEETKEQYRPLFESVFQNEKGENDDD
jgi:hypothetical protein